MLMEFLAPADQAVIPQTSAATKATDRQTIENTRKKRWWRTVCMLDLTEEWGLVRRRIATGKGSAVVRRPILGDAR
jgi:hypothetical protein